MRSRTLSIGSALIVLITLISVPSPAIAASSPTGWLDSVSVDDNSITARGWAADPDQPESSVGVHIYVDGKYTVGTSASIFRADVNKTTGLGTHHGFEATFNISNGLRSVCVYAIDKTGDSNKLLGCRDVQVGPVQRSGHSPTGWLDSVKANEDENEIFTRGWAADPDKPESSVGVHIYVDGKYTVGTSASRYRPDVNKATGLGTHHGFEATFNISNGLRNVCVYAIDKTGDPHKLLGCRKVQIGPIQSSGHKPIGWLDSIVEVENGLQVKGWAADPDTTDSIGVHVYISRRFARGFIADNPRADVNRAIGLGGAHGFRETIEIGSGWHDVCVYAIDKTGDPNSLIACKTVLLNLESNKPIERVSRFTTFFDCCLPRVTNIRLIAREVDRTVVLPGETFSVDEVVGPRTSAGGYVPAPYLINGQGACCAIGGGVSQFGTTIHNAVFWGGYDVVSHRPHSGWISRYPLGIEATLVYSAIDYRFRNDTDTPVIIRTSSTGTSVTVEIWGYQGGWRSTGYHPTGSRSSVIAVIDHGGSQAKRVSGSVSGSAPGTVRIVRTLTQDGVASSETWFWNYVS